MVAAEIVSPAMITTQVAAINFEIPKNSDNPEKTMEFLNLLYTDPDVINLFDLGVEGKHYVKTDDVFIDYPKRTDPANPPYGINQAWMFGNQLISHVFEGDKADIYAQLGEFNKGAMKSKTLSFTYNPQPIKTELATITNVITQYKIGLEAGTLDSNESHIIQILAIPFFNYDCDQPLTGVYRLLERWNLTAFSLSFSFIKKCTKLPVTKHGRKWMTLR